MSNLVDKIKHYATEYYEGKPEISDSAFDNLVDQLKKEDPNNPILNTVGWGYVINNPLNKTQHHRFEVAKFESKVRDSKLVTIPKERARISPKIDGGSVCCYYSNGNLDYAITRGDGVTGYDITDKMKYIVPVSLVDNFTGMVRGEITMKLDIFNRRYSDYSSVRNLAIGMIKRSTISMDELHDLDFVAYTVRGTTDIDISSKEKVYSWLLKNKFNKVDELVCDNWSDDNFGKLIKSYSKYLIDGIVITDNKYIQLDDNTWIPEQEIAYKTKADTKDTTVKKIVWNHTRTGKYVPVVWVDPVELSGATINKVTGFNARFIRSMGIGVGAVIRIQRSGEVIPDIVDVISPSEVDIPCNCPDCNSKFDYDGVNLYCNNPDCPGKSYSSTVHWIKCIAGVKGLGDTIINDFLDTFGIVTIDDLYTEINSGIDLRKVPGVGDSNEKLLEEMIKLLNTPIEFSDFMIACNLKGVGGVAANSLANYRKLILEDPMDDTFNDKLFGLKGINSTGKESIINNISTIRHYSNLIKVIDNTTEPDKVVDQSKIVCLTGALSVTRSKFLEEISNYGWTEGPIKKAKYLITDNPNSSSSKAVNARKLNVPMISESDFRKIMMT